jgi:hypothetical protein
MIPLCDSTVQVFEEPESVIGSPRLCSLDVGDHSYARAILRSGHPAHMQDLGNGRELVGRCANRVFTTPTLMHIA